MTEHHLHHHDTSGHDHGSTGHHHHSAPAAGFDSAFAIGSAINAAFVAAEVAFGLTAHSVALLADAAHNPGDVLGLLLSGWRSGSDAEVTPSRTYGLGRSSNRDG
ncbi:cation transporter [Pseudomonas sp. 10B1]|uniref:cation transporter n=1 Tax=unclassified Pseudomonas TaxID=196821 RepID=UPI002B224302|nr:MULTISPECIES: cation transporter [unclassified Pseudomonas]MEA9993005.1 cation transporter [Pseudomonas sp. AA4]MEB0085948.1 cation transporter [Pseudomonas sp. RTI1]MEB0125617.1 cation transporter [Pseudomonas sp. CCC1.2]MEB0151590.1 cation transporter [Pseudomonas sp. CCC4.3]MEB0218667.1 cation transporter [Pseudomonas sp. AB12(2023)]